mmetsp:Transcript_28733/g.61679  ORF Transcript_28733/g.61679 Transcript_28733/m.61679 type:complete len:411 (-) Transcript_28733:204-1436(-)
MLPSHLLDPTKKKNERLSRTRLGHAPPPLPPSLCVTGAMSRIGRYQVDTITNQCVANTDGDCEKGNDRRITTINDNSGVPIVLSYCIFRPRQLYDDNKPPLLCLHGGPSIPSNYLLPIVNGVTDRAVIFYDQWGCGKSSRPQLSPAETDDNNTQNKSNCKKAQFPPFSIPTMVEHLRQLIEEHWKLKRFHLLGHSFGGILAYEYLLAMAKRQEDFTMTKHCRCCICSLILSSTPTSAKLIQSESERLFQDLTGIGINNDADDCDDDNSNERQRQRQRLHQSMKHSEEFRQTHECRLPNPPLALMDALAQMGPIPWRGIQAINDYKADGKVNDSYRIPSLLMRGEYDFCTESCMKGWKERLCDYDDDNDFVKVEEKVLSNCSHYAMLEDEKLYGAEILGFVKSHDADKKER